MSDKNLKKETYKSYLRMIENSRGSKMFSSFFVKNLKTKKIYDVLNNGEYSCAFFVGSILTIFNLIDRPHATVSSTVSKLKERSYKEVGIKNLKPGDILIWEKQKFRDGSMNEHIGFYLDKKVAVSTSYKKRCVVFHSLDFNSKRKILIAYRPILKT